MESACRWPATVHLLTVEVVESRTVDTLTTAYFPPGESQMLNDDRANPSRRRFDAGVMRIVPLEHAPIARPRTRMHRYVPRTAAQWTALVKVGSGETDIPSTQCEQLRAMGLVLTVSGAPALTRHGRFTLGLPD